MSIIHYSARSIFKITKELIKEEYEKTLEEKYLADKMCNVYSNILSGVSEDKFEFHSSYLPYIVRKLLRQQGYMVFPVKDEYGNHISHYINWSFLRHFRYLIINRKDK